ncbi:MAG: methyltransferase domain-containing protein [Vicinamibacterales bacterium]
MSLSDIDFAQRYRDHVGRNARPRREASDWDRRAPAMGTRTFESAYTRAFTACVDLTGCDTLLDVGCGPGTISLTLAPRLAHVYGLDYSPGMLAAFAGQAAARGLTNASAILRAWDEDWSDVPMCDIAVASRATAVPDFEAAARKLAAKARRRVYLTYPAHGRFVGDDVCRTLGRPREPLPDYLHVMGILHHLGIHPALDYLSDANRFAGCAGVDDFLARVADLAGDLSVDDVAAAREYFDRHRDRIGLEPMRWALFSWNVEEPA